ncbi:MAG: polyprenyl synthetase [Bacteroidetes bacterium QS_8_68_15]|nr:MAG: polyprenyl synthetase [Bacteroidetes bacterium QS_8_68_15]
MLETTSVPSDRYGAAAPPLDASPGSSADRARRETITLDGIRRPVADELEAFRDYFREAMRSDVSLLDKVTRYVLKQKGKRIRPLLVLLAAKSCGRVRETSYRAAALVEILHTATLVHDDVVDEADERRGAFSINALWGNKISVLLGDFLLSEGLLLSLDHGDYDVLHALSDAIRRMSEGELLQIEKSRLLDIDEETYFRIISDKTASLIGACTRAGALSASGDEREADRMHEAGEKLGLAFQIRDDLFDFDPESAVGKPLGLDVQEKKMTLPLIHALSRAGRSERQHILKIVGKDDKDREDLRAVATFAEERDGLTYARERMHTLADEARQLFADFPPTQARDALLDLTQFVVQRER